MSESTANVSVLLFLLYLVGRERILVAQLQPGRLLLFSQEAIADGQRFDLSAHETAERLRACTRSAHRAH